MEKVFARVSSSSPIPVAVAHTSQSPFPLAAILEKSCNEMNFSKIKYIFSIVFFLTNLLLYSQSSIFNIVGIWNSSDYSKNESKTIFSKDGYVSLTINGEEIDGENFKIHGGSNNGEKAELKYEINYEKNPMQIDFIAVKDNIERGRILGIIIPYNKDKFILLMSFNGIRPEKIEQENIEQILTLIRVK